MKLARVVGNLVSTCKVQAHEGFKIMVVRPVDGTGRPLGDTFLAIDKAQAGPGDYVIINEEGGGCSQVMGQVKSPTNKVIVGVVDYVDMDRTRYRM